MVVEGQGYMYTMPFLSMIQQLEESILRRSISVHFNREIPSSASDAKVVFSRVPRLFLARPW